MGRRRRRRRKVYSKLGGDDMYFSEGLWFGRAGLPAGGVGIIARIIYAAFAFVNNHKVYHLQHVCY